MVPIIRPSAPQIEEETNMSRFRRTGTLTTLSFAIGVVLGLVSTVHADPRINSERAADRPGVRLALVAGHRRQPTVVGIDRLTSEHGSAPGAPHARDKDGEVQLLYDEIMRQMDGMIRP
jgi:hypothetical protein